MTRENKLQGWRIHEIENLILSGTYPSATQLAKELEVSVRTINRDLDFMRDMYQAPLEYDEVRHGWYYLEKDFRIHELKFTEGELFYIAMFERLLPLYKNTPLEATLSATFKKIMASMTSDVAADLSFADNELTAISDPLANIDQKIFIHLMDALRTQTKITIGYQPLSKDKPLDRTIHPYHFVCQRGNWYVIAYCQLANEVRVFSLSRIKTCKRTRESFVRPADFNPEKYIDPNFGVLSGNKKYKVKIQFFKTAATWAREHQLYENQTLTENSDGSVTVDFVTGQLNDAARLAMSADSLIKVIEPPELINLVVENCKKILSNY